MNYALYLLQNALRDERLHKGNADEYLAGSGVSGKHKDDIAAFEESRRLAKERIPQLEEAIEKINMTLTPNKEKVLRSAAEDKLV